MLDEVRSEVLNYSVTALMHGFNAEPNDTVADIIVYQYNREKLIIPINN